MKDVLVQPEEITVEMFPILPTVLPSLTAYRLDIRHGDLATMGGKLVLHLAKAFAGHWVWSEGHILADQPQAEPAIQAVIEKLWQEKPDPFSQLVGMKQDTMWSVTAQAQAEFLARGIIPERRDALQAVLDQYTRSVGRGQIVREVDIRGRVIAGQPSLSMTLSSRIVSTQELQTYCQHLAQA